MGLKVMRHGRTVTQSAAAQAPLPGFDALGAADQAQVPAGASIAPMQVSATTVNTAASVPPSVVVSTPDGPAPPLVKASFTREIDALERGLREMAEADLLCDAPITLITGPEEYLFGEEKALLEVIEGSGRSLRRRGTSVIVSSTISKAMPRSPSRRGAFMTRPSCWPQSWVSALGWWRSGRWSASGLANRETSGPCRAPS